MAYVSGGRVEASDYNALITTINQIFGTGNGNAGYGGNSINVLLPELLTVLSLESIDSVDWQDLRNAFADVAAHQGTILSDVLPSLSLLDSGDVVTFFSSLNSTVNNLDLTNNRLNVAGGNTTVAVKLTDIRTTAWSNFIRHEFDVVFDSPDDARFFFNTGGGIRVNASLVGGAASPQNISWAGALSSNSPYVFGGTEYFALTGSFETQREIIAASGGSVYAYTDNLWTISARRVDSPGPNGSNGSIIRFRSDFLDGHSNVFFDTVDGTFTSTIEEVRSTSVFTRPSPSFNTLTSISSGDAPANFSLIINSNTNDYNIASEVLSQHGATGGNITVTINGGITVGSTSTSTAAMTTGTLDVGSTILIINSGRIQGKGGDGSRGGGQVLINGEAGLPGGNSLNLLQNITIDNSLGEIFGGGGGAGGGGSNAGQRGGAGGGGAGTLVGAGGSTEGVLFGNPGTANAGGSGSNGQDVGFGSAGGQGGTGGGPGQNGGAGSNSPLGAGLGAAGGAAGKAIELNGNIATFLGGASSPNVEGSVS